MTMYYTSVYINLISCKQALFKMAAYQFYVWGVVLESAIDIAT